MATRSERHGLPRPAGQVCGQAGSGGPIAQQTVALLVTEAPAKGNRVGRCPPVRRLGRPAPGGLCRERRAPRATCGSGPPEHPGRRSRRRRTVTHSRPWRRYFASRPYVARPAWTQRGGRPRRTATIRPASTSSRSGVPMWWPDRSKSGRLHRSRGRSASICQTRWVSDLPRRPAVLAGVGRAPSGTAVPRSSPGAGTPTRPSRRGRPGRRTPPCRAPRRRARELSAYRISNHVDRTDDGDPHTVDPFEVSRVEALRRDRDARLGPDVVAGRHQRDRTWQATGALSVEPSGPSPSERCPAGHAAVSGQARPRPRRSAGRATSRRPPARSSRDWCVATMDRLRPRLVGPVTPRRVDPDGRDQSPDAGRRASLVVGLRVHDPMLPRPVAGRRPSSTGASRRGSP